MLLSLFVGIENKMENLSEFPITWNWFLCDQKCFYQAEYKRTAKIKDDRERRDKTKVL